MRRRRLQKSTAAVHDRYVRRWLVCFGLLLALREPAQAQPCAGDCGGDFSVSVDELIFGISAALGHSSADQCPGFAGATPLGIEVLLAAVRNALQGCAEAPELGELIGGSAAYVDGTFVWTDYAYDDRGANRDAANGGDRTNSALAGGDTRYPAEIAGGNAADLIQLQIGLAGGELSLRAVLQTLVDPTLPMLGIAFDTDRDTATGAAQLPGEQWQAAGDLGAEVLLLLSSAGGEVLRANGDTWQSAGTFAVAVDAATNTISAGVPTGLLDPQQQTWRAYAALGLAGWADGAAPIFDLAFVANELLVRWQENEQADILAGALDAGRAAATIDFARVAAGDSESPQLAGGRFHTFLYHSTLRLPEGVATNQDGNRSYLGPYQPYAVFIPESVESPAPLFVFLHGLQQNHLGSVFVGDAYLGTGRALSEDPFTLFPMFAQDGFDFPPAAIQVMPLARGEGLFYRGIAHEDVLAVLADAQRRFAIDPERVSLQGASMGGIGTYQIGALEPDRWSAIVPLIGFQRSELLPLSANLRNVPVRQINGVIDPLIMESAATASAARLDELGYPYRYWLLDQRGHEAGGFVYDCVFPDVAALQREVNPARVTYVADATLDMIDAASGLNLRFDGAYWVDAIRARAAGTAARVDATSLARPRYEETVSRIDTRHDNSDVGADLCGANAEIRTGDTWRERGIDLVRGPELARENAVTIELTNVASVAVALARAGFNAFAPGTITITSDGQSAVTLTGLDPGQALRVGVGSKQVDNRGHVVLDISEGTTAIGLLLVLP